MAIATVDGTINAREVGILADASGANAMVIVSSTGNVTGGMTGINATSDTGAITIVNVSGDVLVPEGEDAFAAIEAGATEGGRTSVDVTGDIVSSWYGVDLRSGANSEDNPSSDPAVTKPSLVELVVEGNITSKNEGLYAEVNKSNATIDALVVGTISAGQGSPVALDNSNPGLTENNFNLTVWKIVPYEDGGVAHDATYSSDDTASYTENESFETKIKYIIKVEQPVKGGTASAKDALGNALDTSHDYEYALQDEKVLLKVELDEGYRIVGAYNGLGEKTDLLFDGTDYYVVVPKGGGVYLSVDLSNEYPVTFVNYDGAVLQSEDLVYGATPSYRGETPTKPADDKHTYKFVGWTPEVNEVTGEVTYKATYEAVEKPADPEPADPKDGKATADAVVTTTVAKAATHKAGLPQTGDRLDGAAALGLVVVAGIVLLSGKAIRRKA